MNKKTLFITLITIFILFVVVLLVYPIFYKNNNIQKNNITNNETSNEMKQIDILSNLNFFKILIKDKNNKENAVFAEKFVTIRDTENIKQLQEIISSSTVLETNNSRGYDISTTALCYLDDNTSCNFFVIDSNTIVFTDMTNNRTVYKIDKKYNIDRFLTNLYNKNVNLSEYTVLKENGKYGVTCADKTIISPKYDNLAIINPITDLFLVTIDNVTKIIDKFEKDPFPDFDEIGLLKSVGNNSSMWYENAIKFKLNDKYGLINLNGLQLLPAEYDDIKSLNYKKDYLILSQNKKQKLIRLSSYTSKDITGIFDSIKILGIDIDFDNTDIKYKDNNSLVVVGITNNIKQQYFTLSE